MSISLEKIYYTAMRKYALKLISGTTGLWNTVKWIHTVEDVQVAGFLKGQELVVITGINSPRTEEIEEIVKKVYEYGAAGIVFNIGPFIKEVSESIICFSEENGFPVFTIPWEIRLVEFNRELCELIIRDEQEDQTLCSAYRKAIFAPEDEQEYLPVLINEGIQPNEKYCMIKCLPKFQKSENEEIDFTRIFYEMRLYFERIMNRTQKKYIIFRYDNYLTTIIPATDKEEVKTIIDGFLSFTKWKKFDGHLYIAVSKYNIKLKDLSNKFSTLSYMCKLNVKNQRNVWYWEELGEWEILFSVKESTALKEFQKNTIHMIEEYDQENGTEYCRILDIYLKKNGNMPEVAQECFIHRNTVAYHLKKIQDILNCDIYNMKDRVRLYLALRIKEISEL